MSRDPAIYRFHVLRVAEDDSTAPATYPDGDPVYRASTSERAARLEAMADADALAEADTEARFVVVDASGAEVYAPAPMAAPAPF